MNAHSEIPGLTSRPKFRLTPVVTPEAELHEAVAKAFTMLVLPPAMWTCFPAGQVPLPAHAAAKLYRMGLKRGWPDILVVYGGHTFGIELKRQGGQLSRSYMARTKRGALVLREGQKDVFPRLQAAGMTIGIASNVNDAVALLREWGVPVRATH